MKDLDSFFPENLYHSYVIEGDRDALVEDLRAVLMQRGDIGRHDPDIFSNIYDAFTIADSAIIKEWHNSKSVSGGKKICIIGARFINHEAQQSLLKILEEPQEGVHFFLIVPNGTILLETIRSRVQTIHISSASVELEQKSLSQSDGGRNFLALSVGKRLEQIGAIVESHKDTEGSGGLRYEATQLVNSIESVFYEKFHKDPSNADAQFILEELKNAREYLSVPGCSVKMILEHIALVI